MNNTNEDAYPAPTLGPRPPLPAALQDTEPEAEPEQDSGQARMAYRYAKANAGKMLWVPRIGWHYWDGARWAKDVGDRYAHKALRKVRLRALAESLNDTSLRKDVKACETAAGAAGVLSQARTQDELFAYPEDLDADPDLLNCANGTLDLRTFTLRPHDPADFITKITAASYHEDASSPEWDKFLEAILPHRQVREYTQRVFGQGATGRVSAHLFPILTGTGANGKGTTYAAVNHALGDYSVIVSPNLFLGGGKLSETGPEMMRLRGARLAVASEGEEGRELDAAVMKRLAGGDRLTARHLYQEPIEWAPTHQLVYVTNHLPAVRGDDKAVFRRMSITPFEVEVPLEEMDSRLGDRLAEQGDAVLAWVVDGYKDFVARGEKMDPPEEVSAATDQYRLDSDPVASFLDDEEWVVKGDDQGVTLRELWDAYQQHVGRDHGAKMTERAFGKALTRLGHPPKKTKRANIRPGLGLTAYASGDGQGVPPSKLVAAPGWGF